MGTGRVRVKPHRCRCRTCPQCGKVYGWTVRRKLLSKATLFKHPRLLTLTVKPSHFDDDPRKAFLAITDGRYIARLMKLLGVRRWVCVLELQKSGWPHWHLLVDAPGNFVDMKRAWQWWGWNRDEWKIGGVDLGKQKLTNAEHAIRYITKYVVKYPGHGFPEWVLDLKRRIRWVQASRAIGPVVSDRERVQKDAADQGTPDQSADQDKPDEAAESLPKDHRSLRVRQLECGQYVDFMREFIDAATGELVYRFCGRIDAPTFEAVAGVVVPVEADEAGRRYIGDPGDIRLAMARWIGAAAKEGVQGPSWPQRQEWLAAVRQAENRY